jgi:uncharacterized protein
MNYIRSIQSNACLGIFAKYWQPGYVKTRLASSLGANRSAAIYRHMVGTVLQRLGRIGGDHLLAYTPADRSGKFKAMLPRGWRMEPQTGSDLGGRMKGFFVRRFAEGYERVLLLGTDSPDLPLAHVETAFDSLSTHDVVLGPTEDGGYYLVGARRRVPPIFGPLPWGKPDLWQATIDQLRISALAYATLEPWYDVDQEADYRRLVSRIAESKDVELAKLYELLAAADLLP